METQDTASSARDTVSRPFRNTATMIDRAAPFFAAAYAQDIMGLSARSTERRAVEIEDGAQRRTVIDFARCSYLGLDNHPKIVAGAMAAISDYGSLHWSCARTRLNFGLLSELEDNLGDLFAARVITYSSVLAANLSAMPILASGHLTRGTRPLVVFDRYVHATLAIHKPLVAAETAVVTIEHNDLEALERLCRDNPVVAYICDGVYSMGGAAPIEALLSLQQRYGLFLYIDDAHGISLFGAKGEGFARSKIVGEIGDRTIIAASLGKGFGASGGLLMLGNAAHEDLFRRFAVANAFSVPVNLAGVGAALASAAIHRTQELRDRQTALADRLRQFDDRIASAQSGQSFPIRTIRFGDEVDAITAARTLLDRGFYTSAIFFPTVPQGQAGLRICPTATHSFDEIANLVTELTRLLNARDRRPETQSC